MQVGEINIDNSLGAHPARQHCAPAAAAAAGVSIALLRTDRPPPAFLASRARPPAAVVENLLSKEDLVSMDRGCVCCSLRNDIVKALKSLQGRAGGSGVAHDAILLETTGLADPAPVAFTFFANSWISANYRLDSILCLVDAQHLREVRGLAGGRGGKRGAAGARQAGGSTAAQAPGAAYAACCRPLAGWLAACLPGWLAGCSRAPA